MPPQPQPQPLASSPSISSSRSSPSRMSTNTAEAIGDLMTSQNAVAAGVGEVLQAIISASAAGISRKPIMVDFGNRRMAVGRQRLASMNGRNAFIYLKSKLGLLNAQGPLFLQGAFEEDEEQFVEVDLDSWEELVPSLHRLRIFG